MTDRKNLRLLAVLAHPDDESFGLGGTLAFYARRDVEVHLITATGGEAGTVAPDRMQGYESIADLRSSELACAAKRLGLAGVHNLGYRDSGMPGTPDNGHPRSLAVAPKAEVARKVTSLMRALGPHVVLTHDPVGGYGHPDHILVNEATVNAFNAARSAVSAAQGPQQVRPQKLYFYTFSRRWLRVLLWILPLLGRDPRRWGRNQDIDLVALAAEALPIHARVNYRSVAKVKWEASYCHRSQLEGGPPLSSLFVWLIRTLDRREDFMRAHPPPQPGMIETDLFSGVVSHHD